MPDDLSQASTGIDGNAEPLIVDLLPDAKSQWIDFYNQHNGEAAGLTSEGRAAWSKLEGYAARFALVFHCIRQASKQKQNDCIDAEDIANGITLARWFGEETLRVYRLMRETEEEKYQRELLEYIASVGGTVTVRDLNRGPRKYRRQPAKVEVDLIALAKAGHGTYRAEKSGPHGGRPTAAFVLTNYPDAKHGDGDTTSPNRRDHEVMAIQQALNGATSEPANADADNEFDLLERQSIQEPGM